MGSRRVAFAGKRFFAEAEPTHVPQLDASVFALRDGEAYTSRIVGKSQLTAEYRYTL